MRSEPRVRLVPRDAVAGVPARRRLDPANPDRPERIVTLQALRTLELLVGDVRLDPGVPRIVGDRLWAMT